MEAKKKGATVTKIFKATEKVLVKFCFISPPSCPNGDFKWCIMNLFLFHLLFVVKGQYIQRGKFMLRFKKKNEILVHI